MTCEEYNVFCGGLPAVTHVVQWGEADVWKVGGKVFTVGRWEDGEARVSFKVSDIGYEMLRALPGLRPAPYLASRGMKWIQHFGLPGLEDAALRDYIRGSHHIIAQGLSKKLRESLGLSLGEVPPHRHE